MECFRWRGHSSDLSCSLTKLYQNMELIDCELDMEGGTLKGHRVILGVCSPYLKKLLMHHQGVTTVSLKQVKYKDMKHILNFIYYGKVGVLSNDVPSMMKTAQFLQIASLTTCISQNVSGKFLYNITCEGHVNNSGSDDLKDSESNLTVQESRGICCQDAPFEREDGLDFSCENNDSQSVCETDSEEPNDLQQASCGVNDIESHIIIPNTVASEKHLMDKDDEKLHEDEGKLPSVSVKIEEQEKQEDLTCSDAADLEDDIKGGSYNCNGRRKEENVGEENNFQTESRIKMESEDDVGVRQFNCLSSENRYISESLESKTGSYIVPFNYETKHSCEVSADIERFPTCDENFINDPNKDRSVRRTGGLEVKFESICDVSDLDLKAEKPFGSGVNSENEEPVNEPPLLQPLCVFIKDEPIEYDDIDNNQETNDCFDEVNSSGVARVVPDGVSSQGVHPFLQTEFGKEASAFNKSRRLSRMRISSREWEEERPNSSREDQESFNCLQSEAVLIPKVEQDPALPSHSRDQDDLCSSMFKSACDEEKCESTGSETFSCNICDASFSLADTLKKHLEKHTSKKAHACDVCEKSFDNSFHLNVHMRSHTGEKPFECCFCQKSFSQSCNLINHVRIHTGEKPFKCGRCKASFRFSNSLKVHKRRHTGEKPFSCTICETSFRQSSDLTSHMRIHTGEKPFSCDLCKASFRLGNSLKRHMRSHTGEKPFTCSKCELSFSLRSSLTRHMHRHTGEKPFQCGKCEASFGIRSSLTRHMHRHTGEKPFQCGKCEASFSFNNSLKRHMLCHSEEKPFSCVQCNASFHVSDSLKRHLLSHSGLKPFSCLTCNTSFTRRADLKRHLKIHTD